MNWIKKIKQVFEPSLTCERVNQFIIDYMEDRLPASTRAEFEDHLSMCVACAPFFEQYKDTVRLVRENGQIDIPPDLAEYTMAFLKEHLEDSSSEPNVPE